MRNAKNPWLMTALIISGIGISYIYQMAPSPLLGILRAEFGIQSDALLNLSVSIIFPLMIAASIGGGYIEQKIGNRNLYILTLFFLGAGILMNYISKLYGIASRAVLVSALAGNTFIGAAIMNWYTWLSRKNEYYRLISPIMISFGLLVPLYKIFGDPEIGIGIWGLGIILIAVVWITLSDPRTDSEMSRGKRAVSFMEEKKHQAVVSHFYM